MSDEDEVIADKNKNQEMSDESDDTDTDEVYEVERVLEERGKGKKKEYLVRWKNYGPKHDTWEPEENLDGAKEALNKFLQSKNKGSGGSSGSGGKAKSSKRGSTSARSTTPKNKSGGRGGRGSGSSNAPKRVDEEELDSDNEEEEDDGNASDGEFEPSPPKKKKTTGGDPQQNGHKPGNRIQKKRSKGTTASRRRSTSRPAEQQDTLAKAVNSRIAMNNNSKGTAMSWISDSEDDSDIGEGEGTKKGGEKEFKKNEAIIPDLIVNNGTKDAAEEMDESGQKTPAEKEKEMPTKETEELAESPPIDPSAAKEDNKDEDQNAAKEGVRGESEPMVQQQESAKKSSAKATSSFPNANANHRSMTTTRSRSNSSSATIVTEELQTIKKSTSNAIEGGDGSKEEEKEAETNGTGRILRKKSGTNSRKSIAGQPKSKFPSKLVINALFRNSAGKLIAVANSGLASSCEVQLSSTSEQKIVEVIKEQLKKGPWAMNGEDEDDTEEA